MFDEPWLLVRHSAPRRYSKDERGTWIRTVVTSAALVPEEDVGTSEPCAFGLGPSRAGRTGSVSYSPLPTTVNGPGETHGSVSGAGGGAAAGAGGGAKDAQVVLVHKYCVTCRIWRPVRGHHCSECGHCMVSSARGCGRASVSTGGRGPWARKSRCQRVKYGARLGPAAIDGTPFTPVQPGQRSTQGESKQRAGHECQQGTQLLGGLRLHVVQHPLPHLYPRPLAPRSCR